MQALVDAAGSSKAGNPLYVFVELSLLDGSNRSWRGFRKTNLTSKKIYDLLIHEQFTVEWNMKELANDPEMQWWECGQYCNRHLPHYYKRQEARSEFFKLVDNVQITISLNGSLIFASGGCANDVYCLSPSASFHFRHATDPCLCLTNTASLERKFGTSIYRANLCIDGESPTFRSSGGLRTMKMYRAAINSQYARRERRKTMSHVPKERTISITVQRMSTRKVKVLK